MESNTFSVKPRRQKKKEHKKQKETKNKCDK